MRGGFSCPNKPTTLHAGCPALTGLGAVTPAPYGRACPSHPAARAPTTAPIAPPQAPADKRLDGSVSHVLLAMLPMSGGGSRPRSTRRPYTPLYNPLRPAGVADEAYWRPFHSDFTEKLRSYPYPCPESSSASSPKALLRRGWWRLVWPDFGRPEFWI